MILVAAKTKQEVAQIIKKLYDTINTKNESAVEENSAKEGPFGIDRRLFEFCLEAVLFTLDWHLDEENWLEEGVELDDPLEWGSPRTPISIDDFWDDFNIINEDDTRAWLAGE